jgi:hypothetical protein
MAKRLLALFLVMMTGLALSSHAQVQGVLSKKFFGNWSAGVGGGPNIFFGDLKATQFMPQSSNMNEWKFGGTFTLTKQLSHVFALRGQVLYSELSGTKEFYTDGGVCNEYFDGNVLEWNISGTMNFSNLFSTKYNPKRKFFVFGSLGAGTSSWISKVKDLTTHEEKRKSDDLERWTTAFVGVGSLGAYYSFGEKVNLGIEWSLHGVNSDFVDDSKAKFPYDAYSMFAVNLTYNFNKYNPGKEPDTNANKIFVPVYIPQPVPAEVKPVDTTPPAPVVIKKVEPVYTDTLEYVPMLTKTDSSEQIFKEPLEKGEFYRVQIFAFRFDRYSEEELKTRYKLDLDVIKDHSEDWYRYMVGNCTTYAEAKTLKAQMRKKGFRDAFIIKYTDGTRIPVHGK